MCLWAYVYKTTQRYYYLQLIHQFYSFNYGNTIFIIGYSLLGSELSVTDRFKTLFPFTLVGSLSIPV